MSLGPGEVFIVLVVALLVLGPEKLPGAARQASRLVRDFRRLSTDLTNQFHAAMDEVDPTKENKKPKTEDPTQTVSTQPDPNAPHPGTDGFELIDKRRGDAPLATPDPEAPRAPGAPPGPSDPSAVQPVAPRIPDGDQGVQTQSESSGQFDPPPPDQRPIKPQKRPSNDDPLARFSNKPKEDPSA